ncbi:hypothetical protein EVA_20073 [gut metagenome]|uniref:Uncharacterized protein n=1 Tax=gut metagenome TaxID=749906 RepID=J9FWT1_9ZZZZ
MIMRRKTAGMQRTGGQPTCFSPMEPAVCMTRNGWTGSVHFLRFLQKTGTSI